MINQLMFNVFMEIMAWRSICMSYILISAKANL